MLSAARAYRYNLLASLKFDCAVEYIAATKEDLGGVHDRMIRRELVLEKNVKCADMNHVEVSCWVDICDIAGYMGRESCQDPW
jgi:hypothetical protein